MNKLFTKIAGLSIGLAMAIGVGVAVGSNSKEAATVHAADPTANFAATNTTAVQDQEGDITSQVSLSTSIFTATLTKNGAGYAMYIKKNDFRMYGTKKTYKGNYLTISVTSAYTIKSFVFGGTTALTTAQVFKGAVSVSSNQVTGTSVTASSGTYTINSTEFTIYNNNKSVSSNTQVKFGSITITYASTSIPTTSVDVSPATVTLAPGETQQLTTTVLPANTTDTLSYSSNASGVATVSSSGLITAHADGTATITATSGNYSDTCVVTVETPTTPFITPEKTSTSGYTGCDETIGFTYGNLTGTLGVSTSNANVSAVIQNDDGDNADVVITFNTATASASSVYLKDGSTTLATITVTGITASSVTITGLPASATLYNNSTLNLGSQITVTATGSMSSDVTWESDDEEVATVSAAGVVTPVANGEVNITVTSDDYPSATMTCAVTVSDAPLETTYNFVTNFSSYASSWSGYSSKTLDGKTNLAGDYAATVTLPYASKQTSTITTMPVVADQSYGDVIHISFELTESGYELGNVSITFVQWNTKAPTMKLFKGTDASGTELDSGVVGTKNTISATNVGGTKFVVAMNDNSTSRNQVGVQSIYITLKAAPVLSGVTTSGQKTTFEYGDTFSYGGTLTAHYTLGKADATVSPSKFKYGTTSSFDADSSGTEITVGTSLSHATHDGVYVRVGYSEDSGVTHKWTDAYQISVEDAPAYYMVLDAYTDTGTDYGYKGGIIEIDVTESNLAGNINWSVTAGSVSDASGDNSSYLATITSVGTLTITATDSGDNTNTHTVSFTIVDSLNTVMAPSETPYASTLTFTDKADGSGTADDGATYTVTSDAAESTYEEARGIHFGTNNSATVQYVQLSSSNVASGANNTIRSIVVNASDAQSEGNTASLTVTVGGASFHCFGETSATLGGQANYTFTGSGSGTVVIRAERSEAKYKGIYFKSVVVNYVTEGEESNIANATNMHLSQKAVIDYAEDFNDTLEGICVAYGSTPTTELSSAWSGLATQYDNWFNKGVKELSSDEIAHAKALFANASSVDRNVSASADELQHMLAKYDWIISHYGYSDFLNTDAGTGRGAVPIINGRIILSTIAKSSSTTIAIIAISAVSLAAMGGYFLFRKKKEN